MPGARLDSVSWTDGAGNLWLFGGEGYDSAGTFGLLNDLWRYSAGTWTWISGSSTAGAKGVYGTQGVAAAGNVPGARDLAASWIDSAGDLWLFGGGGGWRILFNDLWRYRPGTGEWTWVSGSSKPGATLGSVPGARSNSVSWTDSAGGLWLFGGFGSQLTGPPPGGPSQGWFNDLWRYSPGTDQWTVVSGSTIANAKGVWGTRGVAAAANVPSARVAAVSWIDSAGDLWLFGGVGFDSSDMTGDLNDLWVY
jgi:N-acetylneuraminic acid mutarotase